MELKTYTRARAAKAALQKILDMHEVTGTITTEEVNAGQYTATVTFEAANHEAAALLTDDLVAKGFGYLASYTEPAILDMGEAGDATPYPAPSPALAEELDTLGVEPKAKAAGYISEASTAEGPTKRVWAIADSMPGAARKDVIEACRQAGIAYGTARTQYQKWYATKKTS